jgi:glycosyltransferase involved in cell wall biosynthesis
VPNEQSQCVSLSVVMPAYNEETAIERVILEHVAVLKRMGLALAAWEIVCVDDGSTDRTPEIMAEVQRAEPRVRVVRQPNQGIFGAFSRAYREARGSHIYSTGSDGQWPAENLLKMFASLQTGADLVIGVRMNRREVYTPARRLISKAFNVLPRVLLGVRVEDAGSVKLGVREVFQIDLISRSPFVEAERIVRAHRAGYKVDFVPIQFLTRLGGKEKGASWKNISTSAVDLLRCLKAL